MSFCICTIRIVNFESSLSVMLCLLGGLVFQPAMIQIFVDSTIG